MDKDQKVFKTFYLTFLISVCVSGFNSMLFRYVKKKYVSNSRKCVHIFI